MRVQFKKDGNSQINNGYWNENRPPSSPEKKDTFKRQGQNLAINFFHNHKSQFFSREKYDREREIWSKILFFLL